MEHRNRTHLCLLTLNRRVFLVMYTRYSRCSAYLDLVTRLFSLLLRHIHLLRPNLSEYLGKLRLIAFF